MPLIKLLLLNFILDHFELILVDQHAQTLHLHLEELNNQPKEQQKDNLLSKGLFSCITVQNFPMRSHQVLLHIKQCRWLNLAPTESFNTKIKAFRNQFCEVRNVEFFLYQLTHLYA
ncbi:ISAon1 family transposase N-terminal region protein [Spirosoma arboris]